MKEYDFALSEYKEVLELSEDYSWAYFNIAQIYWELDRVDDAIIMLKKTIEKNPKDIEAIKLLSQILVKQTKVDDAMMLLTNAMKVNENGDIYYLAAKVFELQGDSEQSKEC